MLVVLSVLAPTAVLAQGETLNDGQVQQFFLGDAAPANEALEVQTGAGLEMVPRPGDDEFQVPVRAELGLTDRLQLDASAELATADSPELEGAEASLSYGVVSSRDAGFALTAGVGVLTTRDPVDGGMRPGVAPYLLAYKDLGPLGLNLQLRAAGLPASGGRESELQPDLAVGAALGAGLLRPMVEAALRDEGGERTRLLAPGLLLRPSEALEFGVSTPARWMANGDRSLGVMAMLTVQAGGK